MVLHDRTPQKVPVQVRIYLGRSDRRMAQHLLYRAQVCAALDEMRSKGVAESMRTDRFL